MQVLLSIEHDLAKLNDSEKAAAMGGGAHALLSFQHEPTHGDMAVHGDESLTAAAAVEPVKDSLASSERDDAKRRRQQKKLLNKMSRAAARGQGSEASSAEASALRNSLKKQRQALRQQQDRPHR